MRSVFFQSERVGGPHNHGADRWTDEIDVPLIPMKSCDGCAGSAVAIHLPLNRLLADRCFATLSEVPDNVCGTIR